MNILPTFETQHFILRALHQSDAPAIFAYASNPHVAHLTSWQQHNSLNDTLRFIHLNRGATLWAIVDKTTHTVIGECGFINTDLTSSELHCALSPDYWGKGIAVQAALLLIDFGFSALHLQKINAWIVAENIRSLRLAQKIGMHETLMAPNHWFCDGAFHDVYLYTIAQPTL